MPYTILGDHSPWGEGKNHLTDDAEESSKTLCGKHLGFNYETVSEHVYGYEHKLLTGLSRDEVLASPYDFCKTCIKCIKATESNPNPIFNTKPHSQRITGEKRK